MRCSALPPLAACQRNGCMLAECMPQASEDHAHSMWATVDCEALLNLGCGANACCVPPTLSPTLQAAGRGWRERG